MRTSPISCLLDWRGVPAGAATIVYIVNRGDVESRSVTVLRRGRDQIAIASGVGEGDRVSLKEPEQEGAAK